MDQGETRTSDEQRLFIGATINVSPALIDVLSRLALMGKAVRPVRAEQLHVTLKFLGDVASDRVGDIGEMLREAAGTQEAFDWHLHGVGAFPSPRRPSVVWAGSRDGGRLAELAEQVEQRCASLGFAHEGRDFHPHVTIARIKFRPPAELYELIESNSETEFGRQRTPEIVLFRSELSPAGPTYSRVHTAPLKTT